MKDYMRAACLRRRDRIPDSERVARSLLIADLLRQSTWYQRAEHVLTYIAFRSEVDTRPIAEMVWRDGKRLWVPKVNPAEKTMNFFEILGWEDLVPGLWGIMEPKNAEASFFETVPSVKRTVPPKEAETWTLLLVPGAAFDKRGFRIGYGGGYYDRLLPQLKHRHLSIGLAFGVQMLPWVFAEFHDWPVDGVLTERGWKKVPTAQNYEVVRQMPAYMPHS